MEIKGRIISRESKIGIVGLGYVGLPLAIEVVKNGFTLIGFDTNSEKIDSIRKGEYSIENIESTPLIKALNEKKFVATTDFNLLDQTEVICICVPTPLTSTKEPDISAIISASKEIRQRLNTAKLIILESTTYPGTTEEVVLPLLQSNEKKVGEDFYLAYSPERIDPGNKNYTIRNTPRIISGITPQCQEAAYTFYQNIVESEIKTVSSIKVAEMTKLLENIFRGVNIALVNELMMLCDRMKINIWEVVESASTKPYGFMPFYPGPGIGGHCIPIDPFYLSWKAREYDFHTEFIELAGKVNENVPYYVVQKIGQALNKKEKSFKGSRILLIGAAYKKNVSDTRNSAAFKIIELLKEQEALVTYHDPFVPKIKVEELMLSSEPLTAEKISNSNCVVILTNHDDIDYQMIAQKASLVLDTRNILKSSQNIFKI